MSFAATGRSKNTANYCMKVGSTKQAISDKISNATISPSCTTSARERRGHRRQDYRRRRGRIHAALCAAGGFQPEVREKLNTPACMCRSTLRQAGSQVIFYDRDQDYSAAEADNKSRHLTEFRELDDDGSHRQSTLPILFKQ